VERSFLRGYSFQKSQQWNNIEDIQSSMGDPRGTTVATIQGVLAFSMTARHSSFARAARELGLTPSTLAKSVARLERQLGLRLFHRTTRKVSLTPDGQVLFERCSRIVEDIGALQAVADDASKTVRGTLRISVPITFGRRAVLPILIDMQRQHPELSLDVRFSDQRVDLVDAGLDAAIRIGALDDSRLVARRIGMQELLTCASPQYLRDHGALRTPDHLSRHRCVRYRVPTSGRERAWHFAVDGAPTELNPTPAVLVDEGEALAAAAVAGAGVIQAPDYFVGDALASGALVEVLRGYRAPPMPVSIVYPTTRHVPARVRELADRLAAHLAPSRTAPARNAKRAPASRPRRRAS
jgi:DNA-binding transcriptional LysR family regulator